MTRLNLNLRKLLEDSLGGPQASVPADIELGDLFEFNEYKEAALDLHNLLAEQRLIAAVWSVPDVLEVRPDLSEDQAWKVLQRCHAELDPLVGLCRGVVARTADSLFGENPRRAKRCAAVLETYNDQWDAEANLIDLLADARHWCDREARDYGKLNRLAHEHYLAELEGERGGSHE